MAASGTLVIRFIGDLKEFERSTASLSARLTKMGGGLTKAVSLPLIAAGVAAGKLATDFEDSMSKIEGLVGASSKQIKTYSKVILTEGPKWGKAPQELADALYFVTSSGFQGAKALDILKQSAKASAGGLGETGTIADLVTSAMNAYKKSNLSASDSVDILAKAVKLGKLESEEFAGQMGQVLPVASGMGVKFDEVSAALASMSMSGTNASEGTTQLRGILASLLKPTKSAEKTLAGMGLSSEGLRKQIADKGLLSVLQTLADKFDGNTAATAAVFGNVRALTGVMNLMGENSATTRDVFDQMTNATGSMQAAFDAATKTTQFKFDKALATVKASAVQLGSQLLPLVAAALEKVTGWVERGMAAWKSLSPEMQKVVGVGLAVAAALGPTLLILGKIIGLVSMFANPVGLAVLAVTALVAAFALVASKSAALRQALADAFKAILPTIKSLADAFMSQVIPAFRSLWGTIQTQLVPAVQTLLPILTPVAKFIITVLGQAVIGAIKGAIQFLQGFINILAGIVNLVKAIIHGDWAAAWDALKQIVGGVLDAVIGAIKVWLNVGILGIFKQGIKLLVTGWKAGWEALKSVASGAFKAVDDLVATVWRSIGNAFTHAWSAVIKPVLQAIVNFLTAPLRTAFTGYRTVVETVWNAARTVITTAWAAIRTVFQAVANFLTGSLHTAFTGFKTAVETVWNGVKGIISGVWEKGVKPVFEKLRDWMGKDGIVAGAFKAAVGAIRTIWDGIKEAARAPVEFVVNTVWNNGLRRVINAIPGHDDIPPMRFARGGKVMGPGTETSDSILALLSRNEYVVQARYAKPALPLLEAVNHGKLSHLPGFADGGPVWPAVGTSTQHGGYPWATWAGDINVPGSGDYGNPVRAYKDGIVAAIQHLATSYGNNIRLNHPDGTRTLYAHLSRILVSVGQTVRAGQIIGQVGATGNASGPHLHFEIAGGQNPVTPGQGAGKDDGLLKKLVSTLKDAWGSLKGVWSSITGMGGDGWWGLARGAAGWMFDNVKSWVAGRIRDLLPGPLASLLFDQGGMLRNGSLAMNLSGKPERVLDPRTTANFEALTLAMNRMPRGAGSSYRVGDPAIYSTPPVPDGEHDLDDVYDELRTLGDRIERALERAEDRRRQHERARR